MKLLHHLQVSRLNATRWTTICTGLLLALSFVGSTGCRTARDMFNGSVAVNEIDVDAPEQGQAVEPAVSPEPAESQVALVSSTTNSGPAVPTLRTLPEGEDLMAAIESAPGPVLIDFYADWCGPCRTQGKVLHELEAYAAERNAQIIKVDIEKHPVVAKHFRVASLPTLMVIKDGEITSREMGLKRAEEVRQLLR